MFILNEIRNQKKFRTGQTKLHLGFSIKANVRHANVKKLLNYLCFSQLLRQALSILPFALMQKEKVI